MSQRCVDVGRTVPTHDQPAEILEPADRALDNPPAAIPSECATILMGGNGIVRPCRDDRFDASALQQLPDGVAVVPFVRNQALRALAGTTTTG